MQTADSHATCLQLNEKIRVREEKTLKSQHNRKTSLQTTLAFVSCHWSDGGLAENSQLNRLQQRNAKKFGEEIE
jgi:hypothetical protein